MNGECKSYSLNSPMKWDEFKAMPEDLQVIYVQKIRERFNAPDGWIADMLSASKDAFSRHTKKLGCNSGVRGRRKGFNEEAFFSWAYGIPEKLEQNKVRAMVWGKRRSMVHDVRAVSAQCGREEAPV